MVQKLTIIVLGVLSIAVTLFVGIILCTLFGAISGWAVGLVFDDSLTLLSQALGIDATPFQLGVIFGFVGGFLRTSDHRS